MLDKRDYTPDLQGANSGILEGYDGDPFTGADGRFIGNDGFVVPKDFHEFHERYPFAVRNWVTKRLKKAGSHPDVEDWTNTLLTHLCAVPKGRYIPPTATQTGRRIGGALAQKGFKDVIHAFNPWAHYGASAQRFFSFIFTCLFNKHVALTTKFRRDALWHSMSLDDACDSRPEHGDITNLGRDYLLMSRSSYYAREAMEQAPQAPDSILVQQFKDYLTKKNPEMLALVDALMHEERIQDILDRLGIARGTFLRKRSHLQKMSKAFCRTPRHFVKLG